MNDVIRSAMRSIGVGFLSLCVFMQVLGAPTSLWSMELAEDLIESSLLDAFSLPSETAEFPLPRPSYSQIETGWIAADVLYKPLPFRPPCLLLSCLQTSVGAADCPASGLSGCLPGPAVLNVGDQPWRVMEEDHLYVKHSYRDDLRAVPPDQG